MNSYYSDDTMYDVDNFLEHYGVKGMKWKNRKKIKKALKNVLAKGKRGLNKFYKNAKEEAAAFRDVVLKPGANTLYRKATSKGVGKKLWEKAHGYNSKNLYANKNYTDSVAEGADISYNNTRRNLHSGAWKSFDDYDNYRDALNEHLRYKKERERAMTNARKANQKVAKYESDYRNRKLF